MTDIITGVNISKPPPQSYFHAGSDQVTVTVDDINLPNATFDGWTLTNATRVSGSALTADDGELTNSITVTLSDNATVTANYTLLISVDKTSLTFVECENYPGRGQIVSVSGQATDQQWTATVTGDFYIGAENATSGTSKTYTGTGESKFKIWPSAQNTSTTTDVTGSVNIADAITIPLTQQRTIGGGADMLYLVGTGDDAKLMVGKWGTEITDTRNIPMFKFGGVVGSTVTNIGYAWASANLAYNPTAYTITKLTTTGNDDILNGQVSGYKTNNGITGLGTDANNSKLTSSPEYHNVINLQYGKGDPCQLVGLTVADIRGALAAGELPVPTEKWRTATLAETIALFGNNTINVSYVSGNKTSFTNPIVYRLTAGTGAGQNFAATGYWYHVTAHSQEDCISFVTSQVLVAHTNPTIHQVLYPYVTTVSHQGYYATVQPVRCVRQPM